jgi:hypothetical protein
MNATSHLRPKHFRRPASREPRPCSGRPMKLDEGGAGLVSRVGHSRIQCRRTDRLDGHRTCANGSPPASGPDVASLNLQRTVSERLRIRRVVPSACPSGCVPTGKTGHSGGGTGRAHASQSGAQVSGSATTAFARQASRDSRQQRHDTIRDANSGLAGLWKWAQVVGGVTPAA